MKRKIVISVGVLALGIGGIIGGCQHSSPTNLADNIVPVENPPISGTKLYCGTEPISVDLNDTATQTANTFTDPDTNQTLKRNVSKDEVNPNAQNKLRRITAEAIPSTDANGSADGGGDVYPLLLSYAEQVIGDYELGDGSADIADPTHVDDIFVSMSRDNGQTWKKYRINRTADKSSIKVKWDGATIDYPGHSVKADMAVMGNNVLVAWQDKYCPSGDPLDIVERTGEDYWGNVGPQGTIDYGGILAPNGKYVYEVPFSCVWTARGVFDTTTNEIDWMKPQQLTSGKRDAAKIWIAAQKDAGFAITWQEDPEGLRSGKGAGPGEGWSGATTNHGADIWYTYIDMDKFAEINATASAEQNASVPLYNFNIPVRISDNARCNADSNTSLPYCADNCQATVTAETSSDTSKNTKVCVTGDIDALGTYYPGNYAILDGDTGASRPAIKLIKTDTGEVITYMAYEETKGLAETNSADQGSTDTNISVEGKAVYMEMFPFNKPVTVSSGNIVNTPDKNGYYQNARRVVLVTQVDSCEAQNYTVGVLYKDGNDTRGGSSDMFVRLSTGLNADLSSDVWSKPVNVSSNAAYLADANGTVLDSNWTEADLHDAANLNTDENTFSPRGFMRGDNVFIGFEYTPNYAKAEQGNVPNNFYIHRKLAGNINAFSGWQGPLQITHISGKKVSTLDPAFLPTSAAENTAYIPGSPVPGFAQSAAGVLYIVYGTYDMTSGNELDMYYSRSTDGGATWSTYVNDQNKTVNSTMSAVQDVEEKEAQAMAVPDGSQMLTAWLQESEQNSTAADIFKGVDSWFGLVDFNVSK